MRILASSSLPNFWNLRSSVGSAMLATMAALRERGIGTLPALLGAKPTDAQLKGYGFMLVPRKKIGHVLKTNRPGSPGAFKRP